MATSTGGKRKQRVDIYAYIHVAISSLSTCARTWHRCFNERWCEDEELLRRWVQKLFGKKPGLKFFRFPLAEKERCARWTAAVRRKNW